MRGGAEQRMTNMTITTAIDETTTIRWWKEPIQFRTVSGILNVMNNGTLTDLWNERRLRS